MYGTRKRPPIPAGAIAAAAATIAFCLLLLWRNHTVFWNDDYQISILPVLADAARSWHEGHWPLLSSGSWACGNLAGEYQYGTFSIFINALIVAVWQLPLSFPMQAAALSIAHLAILAAGAFLLARGRRLPGSLATGVALIAALNGWEIGWGATDWFGALAADAWLPWCWWAFEAAQREPLAQHGRGLSRSLRFLLPGFFVYFLLSAGFPYTVLRLVLLTAWLAARALSSNRPKALLPLITGWAIGLGLSAPAWLSLLEAMRGSGRSEGVGGGNFAWAVPFHALPGLILPNWTTSWQDFANRPSTHAAIELAGGLVPVAALLAGFVCLRGRLWRALRWDLLLLGAALCLCLLPSPGVFRWSFRWLPFFHLILALTGASALHRLAIAGTWARARRRFLLNPGLWATALAALAWAAMCLAHTANHDEITHALPLLILLTGAGWMILQQLPMHAPGLKRWLPAIAVFVSLWATYWHMYTNPGLPKYAFGPGLAHAEPLSIDRLYLSLYREPDKFYGSFQTPADFGNILRPGSTGLFAGIHMVNGYSPIMTAGIGRSLHMETHGSVPEPDGARLLAEESGPDGMLTRLGVDGIIVARDYAIAPDHPPEGEWTAVFTSPEGTIYHRNGGVLPAVRAWKSGEPGGTETFAPAEIAHIDDARLAVGADVEVPPGNAPALLAFRRPYFPGYSADLDGKPLPVTTFRGLLPTVEVPAGSHGHLTLRYRPRAVVWGAFISAITSLIIVVLTVKGMRATR